MISIENTNALELNKKPFKGRQPTKGAGAFFRLLLLVAMLGFASSSENAGASSSAVGVEENIGEAAQPQLHEDEDHHTNHLRRQTQKDYHDDDRKLQGNSGGCMWCFTGPTVYYCSETLECGCSVASTVANEESAVARGRVSPAKKSSFTCDNTVKDNHCMVAPENYECPSEEN